MKTDQTLLTNNDDENQMDQIMRIHDSYEQQEDLPTNKNQHSKTIVLVDDTDIQETQIQDTDKFEQTTSSLK